MKLRVHELGLSGCSCTTPIKKSSGESSEENESWLHFAKVEFSDIGSKNFAVIFSIWDHHIPLQKVYRELFQGSQSFEISLNWAPGNLWRKMKRYFLIQYSIKCESTDILLLYILWYLCSKYKNMKTKIKTSIKVLRMPKCILIFLVFEIFILNRLAPNSLALIWTLYCCWATTMDI